ncbi:MAG: IS1595 family transposase [Rhodospirillaceae bacterium]|nr:IS1595 family transposase [Rhodospirillaceae bacterium]
MASVLETTPFRDEAAAYRFVEARVWPNGPICPHCGNVDAAKIGLLKGKSTRIGVRKCYECRKPFTVKVGTIFESSHIPLYIWLQAMALMSSSKKGISANQLHRILGVSLKSAWFMAHRIRKAMEGNGEPGPLGGEGKIIEADETYVGQNDSEFRNGKWHRKRGISGKIAVVTLIERGGRSRSIKMDKVKLADMRAFLLENADQKSRLMTDEAPVYKKVGTQFASHEAVNHSQDEFARGDVTTNTVESFFSVFKRGMRGTYQHCKARHLPRYLAEFDFRYGHRAALDIDDQQRTDAMVRGVVGKRLTYRTVNRQESE